MSTPLEQSKDTLLKFASSGLSLHASNLIGESVILFAYLNVILSSDRFPRIEINLNKCIPFRPTFDYIIIFIIFWILNSGIIFSVMRLIYYGRFAHEIIVFPQSEDDAKNMENIKVIKTLRDKVAINTAKGTFFKIPQKWFSSGIAKLTGGLWFSFGLGFIISKILFFVFFIK